MRRHVWGKQLLSFVCLSILLTVIFSTIQPVAEAQDTLTGSWDIRGRTKVCVRSGFIKTCEKVRFVGDSFQASDDGSITWFGDGFVDPINGTWVQKRTRKFRIDLDETETEDLMEIFCEEETEIPSCVITISEIRVRVKLKDDNRIRARIRIAGRFSAQGRSGEFEFRGRLRGRRTDGSPAVGALRNDSASMLTNLAQQILSTIR